MISSLIELPTDEGSRFEFKSSQIATNNLDKKICKAASAFTNAGGGSMVIGVSNDGEADGGISPMVGRTSIRDWIDKILQAVRPAVKYEVEIFDCSDGRGKIEEGKVVVAIQFMESSYAPHMSSDNIYYIRAGAHSEPATSFIVEALMARRGLQRPILVPRFRRRPDNLAVLQLSLATITSSPALDISLSLDPLAGSLKKAEEMFPLHIPLIDRFHPFDMDYGLAHIPENTSERNINIEVLYHAADGTSYTLKKAADPYGEIPPLSFNSDMQKAVKSLEKIANTIK